MDTIKITRSAGIPIYPEDGSDVNALHLWKFTYNIRRENASWLLVKGYVWASTAYMGKRGAAREITKNHPLDGVTSLDAIEVEEVDIDSIGISAPVRKKVSL